MSNQIESNSSEKLEISVISGHCPHCGYKNQYDIQITEIVAKDEGWATRGTGAGMAKHQIFTPNPVPNFCLNCGSELTEIQRIIPIITAPFSCPSCGKKETFRFIIHRITNKIEDFEFEVELKCTACEKKRTLKKIISGFFSVIKLEVGPTGISVKNA